MRTCRSVLLILLILVTGPLFSQINLGEDLEIDYANPKSYEIAGITVFGVKYLDNNALILLSGLSIGDRIEIPGKEITKAIQNLWKQGLFENVIIKATDVRGDMIFLNIILKERPRMSTFSFTGVKKSEADNLRDEIKLASGDVVTDNLIIRTTNTIKNYYRDKGFLDASVKIIQIEDSLRKNHVRLRIDLDKK